MKNFRFHKLAAIGVFLLTAAWIATGEFSSVGSAADEAPPPPGAAQENRGVVHTVGVTKPQRVEQARAIHVPGRTEADKRSVLAARTNGIIAELPVRRGQVVKKGDLILRLETEGREAAVETARQLLAQREAEQKAAAQLAKGGNLARLQLDSANSALAEARSQLEAAIAELDRTQVHAPFDGVVDRVNVELGSSVMQGAEIATILSLDPVLAVGQVSEHDLGHVSVGDKAAVRLVSGDVVEGEVRYISRDASEQTRTFRFEVAIPNGDRSIPAGMTAEVTLRARPVESVLVPRSVVTLGRKGELGVNTVNADNKVEFHPIDLVDDTPEGLYLAGVPEDARLIVAGQDLVVDGDEVKPVEADKKMLEELAAESGSTQ
ncbi:multidrug efflux system membrane fusion protein [Mesorhizobium sp. J18]|uniref:efflux RND transporter periplasmic adaptor subunit n=1 Tax=Mesorhizobium sp. J18 TaxID=935263 RepID=UPI00119C876A|nr:efflux RND transporter periplasmic adaptor subunit [Mesorhizobium sp. J18]TWG98922.1 multidrug efflux system membrane fusion protein [Mesorhizobium sp. J18]